MLKRNNVFLSVFLITTVFGGSAAISQTEFGPPGYRGHYAGRIFGPTKRGSGNPHSQDAVAFLECYFA